MPKYGNYCCPECGLIKRDVEVPFGVSFNAQKIVCPSCYGKLQWDTEFIALVPKAVHMDWIPQIGRMSAGNGPTFTSFETTGPDGKLTRINSITELRAMERESEKMAADGRGQQMVWRDFANDKSNKDAHAIHNRWEADDYPGVPGKAQREALRQLTTKEGEARLEEAKSNAATIASPTE